MTQKELLYIEDAVGHEDSIIKILEESLKNIEDESLIEFLDNELDIHNSIRKELFNKLEVKSNE